LGCLYLGSHPSLKHRIYRSKTWWESENKDFFSYVPCKVDSGSLTDKALIPFELNGKKLMARQKVGHPYKHFASYSIKKVWKTITNLVLEQDFYLGVRISEPQINNALARISVEEKQDNGCSSKKCY